MAREIDLTKKLTQDDLQYLVDRGRWDALRQNAENLGMPEPNLPSARGIRMAVPRSQMRDTSMFDDIAEQMGVSVEKDDEATTAAPEDSSSSAVDYTKLTVPQLKEEMDKRRGQYEADGDQEGVELMTYASDARKDDLVTALQVDDESSDDES